MMAAASVQYGRVAALLCFLQVLNVCAFVHDSPECGEPFHCPDECVITWYGKCPSNCYCKPIKRCEHVTCPYPPPGCIIVTGQDGCQRCACEDNLNQTTTMQTSPPTTTERVTAKLRPPATTTDAYTTTTTDAAPITERHQRPTTVVWTTETTRPTELATEQTNYWHTETTTTPIETKSSSTVQKTLELYAQMICTQQYKTLIDQNFKALFAEIGSRLNSAAVYPSIFSFAKEYLWQKCDQLKEANRRTPVEVRRSCFRKYYVFDELISLLSYPCSSSSRAAFFAHFECLQRAAMTTEFAGCLPQDVHQIVRQKSRQVCPMIRDSMHCLQRTVVHNCDHSAWTIFKQYLLLRLLKLDPHCPVRV